MRSFRWPALAPALLLLATACKGAPTTPAPAAPEPQLQAPGMPGQASPMLPPGQPPSAQGPAPGAPPSGPGGAPPVPQSGDRWPPSTFAEAIGGATDVLISRKAGQEKGKYEASEVIIQDPQEIARLQAAFGLSQSLSDTVPNCDSPMGVNFSKGRSRLVSIGICTNAPNSPGVMTIPGPQNLVRGVVVAKPSEVEAIFAEHASDLRHEIKDATGDKDKKPVEIKPG